MTPESQVYNETERFLEEILIIENDVKEFKTEFDKLQKQKK